MPDNPYSDAGLREAWNKGAAVARKRHGSRFSSPYFSGPLLDAWLVGFDAVKVEKAAKVKGGRPRWI